MSFEKVLYDKKKSVSENVEELFYAHDNMVDKLNKNNSTKADNIIFANGASSGTVTVPLESGKHKIMMRAESPNVNASATLITKAFFFAKSVKMFFFISFLSP